MRARTFKNQFEPAITRKVNPKRQTIRPLPKRMPKAGDLESWRVWTGRPYNSPQRELVQVRLTRVRSISISQLPGDDVVAVAGELLPLEQYQALAERDGFKNFIEMANWFRAQHGAEFSGVLIEAEDL